MAAPVLLTAAKVATKKLILDILTDPEKIIKLVLLAVVLPLLLLLVVFGLPIILSASIPSVLFGNTTTPGLTPQQQEVIALYEQVRPLIDKENTSWSNKQKKVYASCDDIAVKSSFDLPWQALMAIDAVRFNQDFTKANQKEILALGEAFVERKVITGMYQSQEQYQVQETTQVPVTYQVREAVKVKVEVDVTTTKQVWVPWIAAFPWLGGHYVTETVVTPTYHWETKTEMVTKTKMVTKIVTVTKTRTVTKHRATLTITTKPFDTVLNELHFTASQKQVAQNIYFTITSLLNSNGGGSGGSPSSNVMRWKPQILAAAAKYHLDPALIAAVIQQESGGNPAAMSPVGAIGLMQLMPTTAEGLGDDPYNPTQNIDAGSHYIEIQLQRFGDITDGLAAYNAGPGNVLNHNWLSFPETTNYVARVTNLIRQYEPLFLPVST